jgi:hypothetical protein
MSNGFTGLNTTTQFGIVSGTVGGGAAGVKMAAPVVDDITNAGLKSLSKALENEAGEAAKGVAKLTQSEVSALKNQLFLKDLEVGLKGQGAALARAIEALRKFRQGTLEIPKGLTRQHLLDYREKALMGIEKSVGKPSEGLARQVQGTRIQLIDEILASGVL